MSEQLFNAVYREPVPRAKYTTDLQLLKRINKARRRQQRNSRRIHGDFNEIYAQKLPQR